METSEQINELALALSQAQGEMELAKKESENPFFHSKYADLASVWETIRKPLTKHGLAIVQTMSLRDDDKIAIATMLIHKSGQWIRGILALPPVKADPQAIGSVIKYGRRFSLEAITCCIGIATEDDDGNEAAKKTIQPTPQPKPQPKPKSLKSEKRTEQVLYITDKIMEMCGYDNDKAKAMLLDYTTFITKDNKTIEGYLSFIDMQNKASDARVQTTYGKIKTAYETFVADCIEDQKTATTESPADYAEQTEIPL